ncbi:xylose isomerase [Planctomycetota bacterium]
MADNYQPKKEDRFTFGLWTVGNTGRDMWGQATREAMDPNYMVAKLAGLGACGVNLHDNDLVPIDASPVERDRIVSSFKQALADNDMLVPMATVSLFYDPVFKDGAFTSSDPRVRAYAVQKTMTAIDLGVDLGAEIFVLWGGREGCESEAAKDTREVFAWQRECINFLSHYVKDRKYDLRFALEAKPNEPRGDLFLPTTGAMLGFIETLDNSDIIGVNPEVAHEAMAGVHVLHGIAQAAEHGKLFHIDLNSQKAGRFDQDLRFGSENLRGMFWLVHLLESCYTGPLHFDAHPYRTENADGVWDFALGCMRTYNMLREKVRLFNDDSEVQGILHSLKEEKLPAELDISSYTPEGAGKLLAFPFDRAGLAARNLPYEQLDQLAVEILMGVR